MRYSLSPLSCLTEANVLQDVFEMPMRNKYSQVPSKRDPM